jgi:hypothetical protein
MNGAVIAAAGLAEAAWGALTLVMGICLFVIVLLGLLAILTRSFVLSVIATAMLMLFSTVFQPWLCFAPFAPGAYNDLDVVVAAERFRMIGIAWIVTLALTLASLMMNVVKAIHTDAKDSVSGDEWQLPPCRSPS